MFYDDDNDKGMRAVYMEELRLLIKDRKYARQYKEYWYTGLPFRKMTPEEIVKSREGRLANRRRLKEYTESEDFDPVNARKIRKKLRDWLTEALKTGPFYPQSSETKEEE